MTKIFFKTHPHRWLILLALAALAFFSLAFTGGDGDTDPAHCSPCTTPTFTRTPTFTPTPTWTPTSIPPVQQCQVAEVNFDKPEYQTGDPIKVRLLVQDAQGKPITGANIDATVNRQPFTDTVQASAIPPLQDMAGYYDGVYLLTDLPGVYTFTFSVSDFGGPRFSPCSATRTVQILPPPVDSCQVTLQADPTEVEVNTPIHLTATITNTLCTSLTTTVQPSEGENETLTPPLAGSTNICTGTYSPQASGVYTFTATGINSVGQSCLSTPVAVIVSPTVTPTPTPTIDLILPSQSINLCGLTKPITATLAISNVTNLTGVAVEMTYDKSFMQVIDAFGPPRPPLLQVEVKPDPNFDPWLRNEVDTNNGKIYFAANTGTPVNNSTDVIYIDWQPQGRAGDTTLNVTATFTDAQGSKTISLSSPLKIEIGPPCSTGIVALQGRTDHSGVLVSSAAGEQVRSYPNGLFAIVSTSQLNFTFPGYLAAQSDLPQSAAASAAITLRAGDVNGDNRIDILDLAQLAQQYQSADPLADLNGDGIVNILDLALVAGNFQQRGPLTNGQ